MYPFKLASLIVAMSLLSGATGCSKGSDGDSPANDVLAQAEPGTASAAPENTAPVVDAVTFSVQTGNSHLILLDAFDAENDTLSWDLISPPSHGTITGTPPSMVYKPDDGFEGPDQFEVVVSDAELSSPSTTITLVVSALHEALSPESQSLTMVKDTVLPVTLSVSGAADRDLFYILKNFPRHGRLIGNIPELTYIPDAGFEGIDRFEFSVGDSNTLSALASIDIEVVYPTRRLNDSGVIWGADVPSGNNVNCVGETVREQDCSKGLDAEAFASTGSTGFQFSKIDENGNPLPVTATDWHCVQDNVTGLMWEVKAISDNAAGTQGLQDPDDVFSWYNSDNTQNAGAAGYDNSDRTCSGYNPNDPKSFCNTEAFTHRMNTANLCGYSDWRMPSHQELDSIVNLGGDSLLIDDTFFHATLPKTYWTASPTLYSSRVAWTISFKNGEHSRSSRNLANPVRLVREAN